MFGPLLGLWEAPGGLFPGHACDPRRVRVWPGTGPTSGFQVVQKWAWNRTLDMGREAAGRPGTALRMGFCRPFGRAVSGPWSGPFLGRKWDFGSRRKAVRCCDIGPVVGLSLARQRAFRWSKSGLGIGLGQGPEGRFGYSCSGRPIMARPKGGPKVGRKWDSVGAWGPACRNRPFPGRVHVGGAGRDAPPGALRPGPRRGRGHKKGASGGWPSDARRVKNVPPANRGRDGMAVWFLSISGTAGGRRWQPSPRT